jgi:hypothetical protein
MNSICHHNKIIIGGSLGALLHGTRHNIPVFYVVPIVPLFFEENNKGESKQQMWNDLSFHMSLSGLLPGGDNIQTLRVEHENTLKIVTSNNALFRYTFDELLIFDLDKVDGISFRKKEEMFKVIDWVNIRSGMVHEHDTLEDTESSFVNKIYFYPSERIDGNHNKKDLVAVSYMSKKQIDSVEYSDTYIRFKVIDMMKKAGIRGARNGRDQNDKTRFKYYAVKAEPAERDIIDISEFYLEETPDNIYIIDKSEVPTDETEFESENKYFNKVKNTLRV